ncbi:hypothetical protein [Aquimarina longa]|uniref:hypothetical protein n=1 Tax=Aquimarina longa TaxID=1080221 RepID=UPI000780D3E0|nr:hypothetical protein [Aquimarina longa]
MKLNIKKSNLKLFAVLAFLGLSLVSCSNDDDNLDINADTNPDRFKKIEIGNASFTVPQLNIDLHTEFDYTGKKKVKKIYYDITPVNTNTPGTGEIKWQVSNHLIPEEYYTGQLNPHIHYHIYFDPKNKNFPKIRPATGTYNLKIKVIEDDNTESSITKEFKIVKKFSEIEIGDDNKIKKGSDELHTEFHYDTKNNTISEIKYELWFKEWRNGQQKPIGKWDNIKVVLPAKLYENIKNPHIHYHLPINKDLPLGDYWLNIYVKETNEKEAVKLSIPFSVIK